MWKKCEQFSISSRHRIKLFQLLSGDIYTFVEIIYSISLIGKYMSMNTVLLTKVVEKDKITIHARKHFRALKCVSIVINTLLIQVGVQITVIKAF